MNRAAMLACAAAALGAAGHASAEARPAARIAYLESSRARSGSGGLSVLVGMRHDGGVGDERGDRCRACHLAGAGAQFTDGKSGASAHPPVGPHMPGEMSCVACHEGDGRALSNYLAHGKDDSWPEPLLAGPFVEASCARCHPAPYLAQTPHLRRGLALFARYSCAGCHTVRGISTGRIGTELTYVGSRRKVSFLLHKLESPRFNHGSTVMPALHMPEEDRQSIVVFLKSLRHDGRPQPR